MSQSPTVGNMVASERLVIGDFLLLTWRRMAKSKTNTDE